MSDLSHVKMCGHFSAPLVFIVFKGFENGLYTENMKIFGHLRFNILLKVYPILKLAMEIIPNTAENNQHNLLLK